MRLDLAVSAKENISRNKAAELIAAEKILVNGKPQNKPSFQVAESDAIEIKSYEKFVSRSAKKLLYFLNDFSIDINGLNCLDIGAAAGGWTQVLLQKGAAKVTAIDVGENQIKPEIAADAKVVSLEKTDLRALASHPIYGGATFDLVVCDASFISLANLTESIDKFARKDMILLFKPQFEIGREARRDKRGAVKDDAATIAALKRFEAHAEALGWRLVAKAPSRVAGKEGNLEYLFHYRKK